MESTTNPATALLGMFMMMQLLVLLGLLLGGIYALYSLGRAAAGLDRLATAVEHLVRWQTNSAAGTDTRRELGPATYPARPPITAPPVAAPPVAAPPIAAPQVAAPPVAGPAVFASPTAPHAATTSPPHHPTISPPSTPEAINE